MKKIELTRDEFRLILLAYQARNKDMVSTENYLDLVFDGRNKAVFDSCQPKRSKREDCNCPNRYLLNGTYMGKYCRCGALNTMET